MVPMFRCGSGAKGATAAVNTSVCEEIWGREGAKEDNIHVLDRRKKREVGRKDSNTERDLYLGDG